MEKTKFEFKKLPTKSLTDIMAEQAHIIEEAYEYQVYGNRLTLYQRVTISEPGKHGMEVLYFLSQVKINIPYRKEELGLTALKEAIAKAVRMHHKLESWDITYTALVNAHDIESKLPDITYTEKPEVINCAQ
jgi:hypothetical protein